MALLKPKKLLVLGFGVTAFHASSAVILSDTVELSRALADHRVPVAASVEELGALESFDAVALEAFEPDGLMGLGVLEQWQELQPFLTHAVVLPKALEVKVSLAKCRLTEAKGVEVDLEPWKVDILKL